MAYADEPQVKTTLLEGSERIIRDDVKRILLTAQQATGSTNGRELRVADADIQEAMAWKDGYFLFQNTRLIAIIRQAPRWYNIDVFHEKGSIDRGFGGRVSRYENISELLHNLELTGTIRFKQEGRRITVM